MHSRGALWRLKTFKLLGFPLMMSQFPLQSDCLFCLTDFSLVCYPPGWVSLLPSMGVLESLSFYTTMRNSNLDL